MANSKLRNFQLEKLTDFNKVDSAAVNLTGSSAHSSAIADEDVLLIQANAGGGAKKVTAAILQNYFSKVDISESQDDADQRIIFANAGSGDLNSDASAGSVLEFAHGDEPFTFNASSGLLKVPALQNRSGSFTVSSAGALVASTARVSDLSSGRVVLAGSSGEIEDSANLLFDGTVLTLSASSGTVLRNNGSEFTVTAAGALVAATAKISDLTSGRVTFAGTSGELEDSSNLTFDGTDLTVASAKVSDLTSGRIVLAGTSGALEDSNKLTFDGSTLVVTGAVANSGGTFSVTSGGALVAASAKVSDLSSGRVVLAGGSGELEDSSNLTFNGSQLAVTGIISGSSHLHINGAAVIASSASVGETLGVTGIATFSSAIDANSTADIADTLTLSKGSGTALSVSSGGGAVFLGTVSGSSTLQIGGQGTFGDVLTANGAGNGLVVANNADINGDLDAAGTVQLGTSGGSADTTVRGDLAVGENLTVTGNFTVNGTSTVVDSTITTLKDPLIVLGSGNTSNIRDLGLILEQSGSSTNLGFFYDRDQSEFAAKSGLSEDGTTNGDISGGSYADLHIGALDADSASTIASLKVEDLTSGRIVLAGTGGEIEDSNKLTFDGSTLIVTGAVANSGGTFSVTSGGALVAASAKVSDLTSGRVVLAGGSGELEDSSNLTFNGSQLAVTGIISGSSHLHINGAAVIASSASIGQTLAVTGISTFTGDIDANSAADIAGTLTLSKGSGTALSVSAGGASALQATTVTTLSGSSTLQIGGVSTLGGDVDLTATGGATGDPDLSVAGYAKFAGSVELDGTIQPDGAGETGIDVSADAIYYRDSDASMKRDTVANIATAQAGAGITATNGVFSIDQREELFLSSSVAVTSGTTIQISVSGSSHLSNSLDVFLNGMRLVQSGSSGPAATTFDYTFSGATVTLSNGVSMDNDDIVVVKYIVS